MQTLQLEIMIMLCGQVLDVKRKLALCTSTFAYENGRRPQFEVSYDVLVMSVGEQTATFGVPGVLEHCYFMKVTSLLTSLVSICPC